MSPCAASIIEQVDFYFRLDNLHRDEYLKGLMNPTTGWVPLSIIVTFGRMVQMGATDISAVATALRNSTVVEVDETGNFVRPRMSHLSQHFSPPPFMPQYFSPPGQFTPTGAAMSVPHFEGQYPYPHFFHVSTPTMEDPAGIAAPIFVPNPQHFPTPPPEEMNIQMPPPSPHPCHISPHLQPQPLPYVPPVTYAAPVCHPGEFTGYFADSDGWNMPSAAPVAMPPSTIAPIPAGNLARDPVPLAVNSEGIINEVPFPPADGDANLKSGCQGSAPKQRESGKGSRQENEVNTGTEKKNVQTSPVGDKPVVPAVYFAEARENVSQDYPGNEQVSARHAKKSGKNASGYKQAVNGPSRPWADNFKERAGPVKDAGGALSGNDVSDVSPPPFPVENTKRGVQLRNMRRQEERNGLHQQREVRGQANISKKLLDVSSETSFDKLSSQEQRGNRQAERRRGNGRYVNSSSHDNGRGRRNGRFRRGGRGQGRKRETEKKENPNIDMSEKNFPPLPSMKANTGHEVRTRTK